MADAAMNDLNKYVKKKVKLQKSIVTPGGGLYGRLWKKGEKGLHPSLNDLTWHKRYFVWKDTEPGKLTYYAAENEQNLKGYIDLGTATEISAVTSPLFGMKIVTSKKTYIMRAKSNMERVCWIYLLLSRCRHLPQVPMPGGLEARVIMAPTPVGQFSALAEQLATEQQLQLTRRATSGSLARSNPGQPQPQQIVAQHQPTPPPAAQPQHAASQPHPAGGGVHPLVQNPAAQPQGGAPPTAELEPPVGWEKRADAVLNRIYYLDHINRRTQWHHPSEPPKPNEVTPPPYTYLDDTDRSLPPGWERKLAGDKSYYVDHIGRKSTYEDPRVNPAIVVAPPPHLVQAQAPAQPQPQPQPQAAQVNPNEVPQGWEAVQSPQHNGKMYYIDHINRTTQWNHPGLPANPADGPAPVYPISDPSDATLPAGWQRKLAPNGQAYFIDHVGRRSTYDDPRNRSASPMVARPSQSQLQAPFQQPQPQQMPPQEMQPQGLAQTQPQPQPGQPQGQPANLGTPVALNPGEQPLPQGWEKRLDGQGRPYFVDHVNKKSTRDDPRLSVAVPMGGQPQPVQPQLVQPQPAPAQPQPSQGQPNTGTPVALAPGEDPLPQGWEKRLDGQGRPYFVDHINKKSTRDDPRVPKPQ